MNGKNPSDVAAIARDKSWNDNHYSDRIGFINRNALTSEHISTPQPSMPMGRDFSYDMEDCNGKLCTYSTVVDGNLPGVTALWSQSYYPSSIAGIAALDIEQVFGQSELSPSMTARTDLFIQKWIRLRQYNNATESFQHGDIGALTASAMNIMMHIANARRALRLMRKSMDDLSWYNSGQAILAALGWHFKLRDMTQHWADYWEFFNDHIITQLNNVIWYSDVAPGAKRWAALMSDVYKDTDADTPYTQLFVCRPASLWELRMEEVASLKQEVPDLKTDGTVDSKKVKFMSQKEKLRSGVYGWVFRKAEHQENYWDRFEIDDAHSESSDGWHKFQNYLEWIHDQIITTFYDSGAMNILSTINTLEERGGSSSGGVSFSNFNEDPLPWDVNDPVYDFKYTWDFSMMLAIHNATPAHIEAQPAYVEPATGNFIQSFMFSAGGGETAMKSAFSYGAWAAKMLNLPAVGATNADFANAMSWTITLYNTYQPSVGYLVPSECLSSDYVYSIQMYYFKNGYATSDTSLKLRSCYFQQFIPLDKLAEVGTDNIETTISFPAQCARTLKYAQHFTYLPIIYTLMRGRWEGRADINCMFGVLTNLEVPYSVSPNVLYKTHIQWVNNFWGFPSSPIQEGTPQLEYTSK